MSVHSQVHGLDRACICVRRCKSRSVGRCVKERTSDPEALPVHLVSAAAAAAAAVAAAVVSAAAAAATVVAAAAAAAYASQKNKK